MKKLLISLIIVSASISVCGQIETKFLSKKNVLEQTFLGKVQQRQSAEIKMPAFDLNKLIEEDKMMDGKDVPFRFGNAFNVSYSLEDGQWQNVDDGRVWTMSFTSEGALSLNFVFRDFSLPEGACLYIANKEGTVLYGPVTSKDIPESPLFLTDIIPGSSSTIYLYEPTESLEQSSLSIVRIVHGYRGVFSEESIKGLGSSAPCNVDVACHPEWQEEADAVACILLSGGDALCSGSLLMTTNLSFRPFLLTAFHCVDIDPVNAVISNSEASDVNNWLFKFRYKKHECGGDSITLGYTYNGATFRTAWRPSDFALLEINNNLKSNPNLKWLGWDNTGVASTWGACIHHPGGDIMKISIDEDPITSSSWFSYNDHWHAEWEEGITQGGSSGAPLLNSDKRVIGQVHGKIVYNPNVTPCERLNTDFGKFNLSWNGDGTNKLSTWLDSIGTNATYIDGARPSDFSIKQCGINAYKINNLPDGYNVNWYFPSGSTDITQNTPQLNYCTIGSSNNYHNNEPIVASIRKNNIEVAQRRAVVRRLLSFLGTYSQREIDGTISIPETFFDNYDTLYVNPNRYVTITSSAFSNKTITYTGASLAYWNYDNDETITVRFQTFPRNQNLNIVAQDSCGCTHVTIVVNSNMFNGSPLPLLVINQTEQSIDLNINTSMAAEYTRNCDTDVEIEIVNATTGQVTYKGVIGDAGVSVSTVGWTPGMYVLRSQVGDKAKSYKISVK